MAFCYGLIGTSYQSQQQTNSNNSNESVQSLFISDPFMQIPHHQPPIKVLILLTEKRPRGLKNRNSFVVMAISNILLSPDLPTKESFGEEDGYLNYLLLICKLMIPVMVSESAEYYSKLSPSPQTITYSGSMLSSEWAFLWQYNKNKSHRRVFSSVLETRCLLLRSVEESKHYHPHPLDYERCASIINVR